MTSIFALKPRPTSSDVTSEDIGKAPYPAKKAGAEQSEVAAGRIARFTPPT